MPATDGLRAGGGARRDRVAHGRQPKVHSAAGPGVRGEDGQGRQPRRRQSDCQDRHTGDGLCHVRECVERQSGGQDDQDQRGRHRCRRAYTRRHRCRRLDGPPLRQAWPVRARVPDEGLQPDHRPAAEGVASAAARVGFASGHRHQPRQGPLLLPSGRPAAHRQHGRVCRLELQARQAGGARTQGAGRALLPKAAQTRGRGTLSDGLQAIRVGWRDFDGPCAVDAQCVCECGSGLQRVEDVHRGGRAHRTGGRQEDGRRQARGRGSRQGGASSVV
mmetsp:Transcript_38362/g.96102  ORF Transcript_38362/g.96102 Transcript_38362/m.96102 type:complete len:275 (-) Transcript_38362:401-1225(-)